MWRALIPHGCNTPRQCLPPPPPQPRGAEHNTWAKVNEAGQPPTTFGTWLQIKQLRVPRWNSFCKHTDLREADKTCRGVAMPAPPESPSVAKPPGQDTDLHFWAGVRAQILSFSCLLGSSLLTDHKLTAMFGATITSAFPPHILFILASPGRHRGTVYSMPWLLNTGG